MAFYRNGTTSVIATNCFSLVRYDYGPFGEVIRATGPMVKANPVRFSTKYYDDESDLLYYGYRYYKAITGTWVSRDPLGDYSFLSALTHGFVYRQVKQLYVESLAPIYGFVGNNPISTLDTDGLFVWAGPTWPPEPPQQSPGVTTFQWHPQACRPHTIGGFIQVGLGGGTILGTSQPFVDDGSTGLASTKPNCPPLFPASTGDYFEDTPAVLFGAGLIPTTSGINGLKFEVCHVCLQKCTGSELHTTMGQNGINSSYTTCFSGYKIISIGPCMTYTIPGNGGAEQLNSPVEGSVQV